MGRAGRLIGDPNSVARFFADAGDVRDHGFGIEGLHEKPPGGIERRSLRRALASADKAALFKTFIKVLAQRNSMMATFMAKWSRDWPGQSGHIHLSLRSRDGGKPVFHDPSQPHSMSATMRHFVGGQQRLMPELLAMVAPTVNSYTRLIPGFWAPTDSTVGVENALRLRSFGSASRSASVSGFSRRCQSYVILAAAGRAGGHRESIEPDPLV